MASINPPSSSKSSRFSTLKVFKFAAAGSSKPPPLPPKDPHYYPYNRSLLSLSPDSLSLPQTPQTPSSPLSPPYPRLNPSHSTMSLVSSAASIAPSAAESSTAPSVKKAKKEKGFFKFAKRSPRLPSVKSPPPVDDTQSQASGDDEGISMPWNFQHHIHVDEGFSGLPPSWSASLANAGFSEEEIAAIQARRAGARSPGSQYLYTDRPRSPANSPTLLARPTPRTTSLPRQASDPVNNRPHPPMPALDSPASTTAPLPRRSFSIDSSRQFSEASSGSFENSGGSDGQYSSVDVRSETGSARLPPLSVAGGGSSQGDLPFVPRRTYHVTNDADAMLTSPPPAYDLVSRPTNFSTDRKEKTFADSIDSNPVGSSSLNLPQSSQPQPEPSPSRTLQSSPARTLHSSPPRTLQSSPSRSLQSTPPRTTVRTEAPSIPASSVEYSPPPRSSTSTRRSKRFTALPPRLSLHDSDLSSWTEALISSIPSALSTEGDTLASSTLGSVKSTKPLSSLPTSASTSLLSPPAASSRRAAPQIVLRSNEGGDQPVSAALSSSSPLWDEIMGVLQQKPPLPYSPAVTEAFSPVLPRTPASVGVAVEVANEADEDEDEGAGDETVGAEEDDEMEEGRRLTVMYAMREGQRDANRDSGASMMSTSTVTGSTIVRTASVATRAHANVVGRATATLHSADTDSRARPNGPAAAVHPRKPTLSTSSMLLAAHAPAPYLGSPQSSTFGSEESSADGSGSSSSSAQSRDNPTPLTEGGTDSPPTPLLACPPDLAKAVAAPQFLPAVFAPRTQQSLLVSVSETFGGADSNGGDEDDTAQQRSQVAVHLSPGGASPALSPLQRYRGWLSEVVAPLEEYIDETVDPRDFYCDLQEIAEGESGSVFSARVVAPQKLRLPAAVAARDAADVARGQGVAVAIKNVPIVPAGSPKLDDLRRELRLLRGVWHENVLGTDMLYVDLVEDSLWIRMELMERSLADVVGLVGEGLMLQERMIARFASDILNALEYLQSLHIAHRDLRSDNLLLNRDGVLKLADFSTAVQVRPEDPTRSELAGVVYWQAPEVRQGSYNALKVDVWSLGATVWEMAEAQPPFSDNKHPIGDRWPPLAQPELYSRSFHEFLRQCSEPAVSRPEPSVLSKTDFIHNACGRVVIVQMLAQCVAIEKVLLEAQQGLDDDDDS